MLIPLLLVGITAQSGLIDALKAHRVTITKVDYKGRSAVKVTEIAPDSPDPVAVLTGSEFRNGTIEIDLAGTLSASATATARGFVGVAFHIASDPKTYECFYLRPTNGRADDQVRRNHSAQYISHPDFPWERLRKETPEKYESYVDLQPGEWTKVKIVVDGVKARLYVHGNEQPTLIVNDLKLGAVSGAVGLWIGPGTEGYFSNLKIH